VSAKDDEWMVLNGSLTMETVPAMFEEGVQHLASEELRVDLSQVEAVDSAAVSMLLGWTRAAQRNKRELYVKGLPGDLLSLAKLYGVADLLPHSSD